jgi:beta-D-galactosyl-(1->4)-L-rhamnose phosphorylase
MDNKSLTTGGFTLPGEAGYESLTLELAKRWGADVIRDSDGTQLSDQITTAGYEIYSTLCLVRADNEWAKANRDKLQQCCIMSHPVVATGASVTIELLRGYFREQFRVNGDDDPREWWQVFDRTTGQEVPVSSWSYEPATQSVTIDHARKWHAYTVNFFSYRIWEEISMYNHVTNAWGDREHLMPIEPMHPEVQEHILAYLERWLRSGLTPASCA